MKLFILSLLFLSNSLFAQSVQQKSLSDLKQDLEKIELAIETTRAKMNEIKDARFLPDLYFMLAELHVDKGRYMILIKQLENKDTPIEELDFTAERKPKLQAIDIYNTILEKFPNLEGRDKALFFIAHEYRELGQLEDMVKTYQRLTSQFPSSPYWSESMLVIGDHFFENKKDFDGAQAMYQRIINRPPSPYTPLARYKLGWTYLNQEEFKKALLSFEKVLTDKNEYDEEKLSETYKKTDVKREALLALVRPYSELEPKELAKFGKERVDAIDYFYSLSNNVTSYRRVLNRLAQRMRVKNRYIAATRIYFEYLRIATDLQNKLDAIEDLYRALKESGKEWPVYGYTQEIIEALRQLESNRDIFPEEKKAYRKNLEIFARDSATRIQERAKKTGSKKDYIQAALAYESYLSYFKDKDKRTNTMLLNLAETYFNLDRLVEAGKTYEELFKRMNSSKYVKRFMDSSIQSYITALKTPALLNNVELTQARHGLQQVGEKFVKNYPTHEAVNNIRFTIARSLYDERDFDASVEAFKEYLNRHPKGKNAEVASNLILDAYNQREDFEGLIREGKKLVAYKRLDQGLRRDLAQIVKQAEYKKVQMESGDFSNPEYAQNLLKFAEKYKGSALGDKALYEAFTSYKSKKDPRAYQAGEQLLLKHADSQYAKAVVSEMGKMALFTADFRRAAQYFEVYANKYPVDPESKDLMLSAAQMRESMGDYNQAKKNYLFLGNQRKAAEMDFLAKNWPALEQTAKALGNSLLGNYYQGLSLYRRDQTRQARPYLERASRQAGGAYEEQTMAAHSLYLLTKEALKAYEQVQMQAGNEAQSIQVKSQQLDQLTSRLNQVIKFGNGKWTIASLYSLGGANKEFANFITNAPIPQGLNASQVQQYRQALKQQASQYEIAARNYFKQCLNNAERFEVFTIFVKGCLSRGSVEVNEEKDAYRPPKAKDASPLIARKIRRKLYDEPRNILLLLNLAKAYRENQDYAMSNLILNRAVEIKPKDSTFISQQGVNWLYMNNFNEAKNYFDRALKINSRDPYALKGIAALYEQFRFGSKLKRILKRAKGAKGSASLMHPWMRKF